MVSDIKKSLCARLCGIRFCISAIFSTPLFDNSSSSKSPILQTRFRRNLIESNLIRSNIYTGAADQVKLPAVRIARHRFESVSRTAHRGPLRVSFREYSLKVRKKMLGLLLRLIGLTAVPFGVAAVLDVQRLHAAFATSERLNHSPKNFLRFELLLDSAVDMPAVTCAGLQWFFCFPVGDHCY
jgi:hypothetical protein